MKKKYALIALATAAVVTLAGCGTTEAASGEVKKSSSGEKITIVDARGKKVVLDGPAVRVAGTEWNVIENLVSLGVMPVGASDVKGYETWVSAAPLDDTVTDIGTRGEPSIDTLASLDLDLVIVTDELVEGAMEQVEGIVPVIVVPGGNVKDNLGQMFDNLNLIAKATGTEDKAQELKEDFDKKVDEGKAAIEKAGAAGEKVAFSDAWVDAGSVSIRPFAEGSLVSDVLAELSFENPWDLKGDEAYGLASTDIEGLTSLGDVHFWYIANDAFGDPYTDELKSNAIWTKLPFVTSGKVHRFDDSIWMFGGPASMSQIIDAAVEAVS